MHMSLSASPFSLTVSASNGPTSLGLPHPITQLFCFLLFLFSDPIPIQLVFPSGIIWHSIHFKYSLYQYGYPSVCMLLFWHAIKVVAVTLIPIPLFFVCQNNYPLLLLCRLYTISFIFLLQPYVLTVPNSPTG